MNAIVPVEEALEPTSEVIGILEEFLTKLEAGDRLNPEDLTARCPALAEPLKACLESLEFLHDASKSLRDRAPAELPSATECHTDLGRLGDFQLVREIGRGGMGVVYEAEQISLGRRVALKVLPSQAARDHTTSERFRREARASARLHHTNIVPVFEVGQDGDVRDYAMQYIQGQSLHAVIDELRMLRSRSLRERGHRTGQGGHGETRLGDSATRGIGAQPRVAESLLTGRFEQARTVGPPAAVPLTDPGVARPRKSPSPPCRRGYGGHGPPRSSWRTSPGRPFRSPRPCATWLLPSRAHSHPHSRPSPDNESSVPSRPLEMGRFRPVPGMRTLKIGFR